MAANSFMFDYENEESPRKSSPPVPRVNGECHRNKFSAYTSQDTIPEGSYNDITYHFPEATEEARKNKIKEHVDEFIGNSTLHGFHYCFDKRYRLRRLIWTVVLIGSVCVVLNKLSGSAKKFFDYPFSSTTSVIHVDEIEFPAISICNINDLRMSKMHNTKLHKLLQKEEGMTMDNITGHEYASTTRKANHELSSMTHDCDLINQPCSAKNFTHFFQTQGEKCYTINSGDIKGKTKVLVTEAGIKQSFSMTLNIEHYEYYVDTKDSGLRLIIHDQNETPVRFRGLALSPGFTTYVEITKRKTINLKLPYKTACGSRKLKYYKHYSENTCYLERLTDHVVKYCQCRDGFMPGNARVCSIKELMNCTWPKWAEFNGFKDIDCPIPCEVVQFDPLVSYAQFPSNKYADFIAKKFDLQGTNVENRIFIRDNYLRFFIYFGHMSYTKMEQTPSYDLMVFLGDIGGQLGLFLGTSILTYMEFFDTLAMVIYSKYFEIFKSR